MKRTVVFTLIHLAVTSLHAGNAVAPPAITQEISSFGACVANDFVYVYGGHTGGAHEHSRDNLSADFIRYPINGSAEQWEELPEDKGVQGTALVSWNGLVIRVGGMYATNAPDEDSVMFSTDTVRCFDPKSNEWIDWPSLPEKVSSHDAIVMDDVLYVVGGWKLDGPGRGGEWHEHGWYLDLNDRKSGWRNLPPMPEIRRAGTLAAAGGEIWWVGGMASKRGVSGAVFAFDPKKNSWRKGPSLPAGSEIKGFGSATFSADGRIFNSGMDGHLYSLDPQADAWDVSAVLHTNGRIFHRSLSIGDGTFWTIAGAAKKGHRSDIEVLPVPERFPMVSDADYWPSFRGGSNNEVAERKLPDSWNKEENVGWQAELPGYGQSAPVFANGGVYVTSSIVDESVEAPASPEPEAEGGKGDGGKGGDGGRSGMMEAANGPMKTEVAVSRLDFETGKILWTAKAPSSKPEPSNKYRVNAAPSPCADDKAVYAWFESGDLVAIDHDGKLLWHRNIGESYGEPMGNHGIAGSVMHDEESLYVLVDHGGPSYLLSLDKVNGETRWKVDREERVSWSTPVVTDDAIIICSNGIVEERDKVTGEQRWVVEGIEGNTVASPLVFDSFVLAPSSEKGHTQLLRRGETDDRVVWKAEDKNTASFASPIFTQGQVILVSKAGIASGLDWRTGEERWTHRLPEGNWATPIAVGKTVYFFSKSGTTLVTRLTPSGLHDLRTCELSADETVYGVIPAGEKWIIRTGPEVTAISNQKKS